MVTELQIRTLASSATLVLADAFCAAQVTPGTHRVRESVSHMFPACESWSRRTEFITRDNGRQDTIVTVCHVHTSVYLDDTNYADAPEVTMRAYIQRCVNYTGHTDNTLCYMTLGAACVYGCTGEPSVTSAVGVIW